MSPCKELATTIDEAYADASKNDRARLDMVIEDCQVQWNEATNLLTELALKPSR